MAPGKAALAAKIKANILLKAMVEEAASALALQ